jgi:hypothetical protein
MNLDHLPPAGAEPLHAAAGDDDPPERPPADFLVDGRPDLGQSRLRSLRAFSAGELIAPFRALRVHAAPTRMTVQVSEADHVELSPAWLAFVNHSCAPNVRFDPDLWHLVAERAIASGDELTFFYPSTEWTMATPFACRCGAPGCLGRIDGASRIPAQRLGSWWLARHIRARLAER